jgi:glycerol-3-phosphate dehydrogenase
MTSDYDLLVIGGGINGAAIARDAAGRGLAVLLVEQGDLAQGTSSASTKLIHGGLRYLEYGAYRLVRESLRERETMLAAAPHIIRPIRFIVPHQKGMRPWWMVRAGLWLYDLLGWGGSLPRSAAMRLMGGPLHHDLTRGFAYWDAWVDDARLVVLNALDAAERGAEIATRTRLASARAVVILPP